MHLRGIRLRTRKPFRSIWRRMEDRLELCWRISFESWGEKVGCWSGREWMTVAWEGLLFSSGFAFQSMNVSSLALRVCGRHKWNAVQATGHFQICALFHLTLCSSAYALTFQLWKIGGIHKTYCNVKFFSFIETSTHPQHHINDIYRSSTSSRPSQPWHQTQTQPNPPNYPREAKMKSNYTNRDLIQELQYFGHLSNLANWQRLCLDLSLNDDLSSIRKFKKVPFPLPSLTSHLTPTNENETDLRFEQALQKVWVNIWDFLDQVQGGRKARIFETRSQLAKYMKKQGKFCPKGMVKVYPPLKALLVHMNWDRMRGKSSFDEEDMKIDRWGLWNGHKICHPEI